VKRLFLFLLLAGCRPAPLPICECPSLPDAGASPDSGPPDLAAFDLTPDLAGPVDLANGDAQGLPEIFEVVPNAPMRPGDTVQLLGRNLGCKRSYCSVLFGTSYASLAQGGDESSLSFTVPDLALPEGGAYLELRVYNSAGSAQKLVAAVPMPLLPSGSLDILWRRIASPTPTVGAITRLDFTLRSNANQPLPVLVTAQATSNGVSVHLGDSGAATPLAPGATRDFFVELTPQVANAAFALELRAAGGGLSSFFSVGDLQVGSPSPSQDFDLDLKSQVLQARSAVDDLIAVGNVLAQVRVIGELHSAGTWALDAQSSSSDWKVGWWTPTPPPAQRQRRRSRCRQPGLPLGDPADRAGGDEPRGGRHHRHRAAGRLIRCAPNPLPRPQRPLD
jgi:hypothetical protein